MEKQIYQIYKTAITKSPGAKYHFKEMMLDSSVGRALHQYHRGHGFESHWSLIVFQAFSSNVFT